MHKRPSIATLIFSLLIASSLLWLLLLFYSNLQLFSAIDTAQRNGELLSSLRPVFDHQLSVDLFAIIIISTIFLLPVTFLLIRWIILPIKRLQAAFIALSQGDLNVSVQPEGASELQLIGRGFNAAAAAVKGKTETLAQSNTQLKTEYGEAKKINDLTVDRELTMIKMKEEIEQLRRELARARSLAK